MLVLLEGFIIGVLICDAVMAVLIRLGSRQLGGALQAEVAKRSHRAWQAGCPACGWKPTADSVHETHTAA